MLKGALVGYGFIGAKGHLPAYMERSSRHLNLNKKKSDLYKTETQTENQIKSNETHKNDIEIVAVCDTCPDRIKLLNEKYPQIRTYTDFKELLLKEASHLDFVDISTPPYVHAQYAAMALEMGLHVLCEKPLTTNLKQAQTLIELAKKSGKVLFPCHNYKHAPVVKKIRSILDSEVLGPVHTLSLTTLRNTHAKGVLEWDTHWRRKQEFSGGGIAMDHGSHTFYLTFDWLGTYPTRVSARTFQYAKEWNTEDNVTAVLEFPNGVAHVLLSWTAGMRKVIYSLQGDKGGLIVNDDEVEIAIQEKTSAEDIAQGAVNWTTTRESIASNWMDASHVTWFNSLLDQFIDAISHKHILNKDLLESYRCIEIIQAIEESSREGGKIVDLVGPQQ